MNGDSNGIGIFGENYSWKQENKKSTEQQFFFGNNFPTQKKKTTGSSYNWAGNKHSRISEFDEMESDHIWKIQCIEMQFANQKK